MSSNNFNFAAYMTLSALFALILGFGILISPSNGLAQNTIVVAGLSVKPVVHGMRMNAFPAALHVAANQDPGQAAPPVATPSQPKQVEMPEGDGKAIAMEYCQDCHRLTNLIRAHKTLDEWKDTVQTMMDRGARLPQENVDTLAKYLAANFAPGSTAPATGSSAPSTASPPANAAPPAPVQLQTVELPEGDGKAIATENCQFCHKLTNLMKAHKSLDEWKDTVQTMIDRGANVPADQINTLVTYLAKNFGPKVDSPVSATPAPSSPQAQ